MIHNDPIRNNYYFQAIHPKDIGERIENDHNHMLTHDEDVILRKVQWSYKGEELSKSNLWPYESEITFDDWQKTQQNHLQPVSIKTGQSRQFFGSKIVRPIGCAIGCVLKSVAYLIVTIFGAIFPGIVRRNFTFSQTALYKAGREMEKAFYHLWFGFTEASKGKKQFHLERIDYHEWRYSKASQLKNVPFYDAGRLDRESDFLIGNLIEGLNILQEGYDKMPLLWKTGIKKFDKGAHNYHDTKNEAYLNQYDYKVLKKQDWEILILQAHAVKKMKFPASKGSWRRISDFNPSEFDQTNKKRQAIKDLIDNVRNHEYSILSPIFSNIMGFFETPETVKAVYNAVNNQGYDHGHSHFYVVCCDPLKLWDHKIFIRE